MKDKKQTWTKHTWADLKKKFAKVIPLYGKNCFWAGDSEKTGHLYDATGVVMLAKDEDALFGLWRFHGKGIIVATEDWRLYYCTEEDHAEYILDKRRTSWF